MRKRERNIQEDNRNNNRKDLLSVPNVPHTALSSSHHRDQSPFYMMTVKSNIEKSAGRT